MSSPRRLRGGVHQPRRERAGMLGSASASAQLSLLLQRLLLMLLLACVIEPAPTIRRSGHGCPATRVEPHASGTVAVDFDARSVAHRRSTARRAVVHPGRWRHLLVVAMVHAVAWAHSALRYLSGSVGAGATHGLVRVLLLLLVVLVHLLRLLRLLRFFPGESLLLRIHHAELQQWGDKITAREEKRAYDI